MFNRVFNVGDPIWIPGSSTLYYPDTRCPNKFKVFDKPICAWFVEKVDDKWAKVMYDNLYWSVEQNSLYPYPQENS